MSSVLSAKPWLRDPNVVNIPWREELVTSCLSRAESDGSANDSLPLKLGVYWNDGVVTPQPPIARGLRTVVEAIQAAGHKVNSTIPGYSECGFREFVLIMNNRSWNGVLRLKQLQSVCTYSHLLQFVNLYPVHTVAHLSLIACFSQGRWRSRHS